MSVSMFFDFDDTVFPSSELLSYYSAEHTQFTLPPPVNDQVHKLDSIVHTFLTKFLLFSRIRIITYSSPQWVNACVRLMPLLNRYVSWGYVHVIYCENTTKHAKLDEILAREPPTDMYISCADTNTDLNILPEHVTARTKTRQLRFAKLPDLHSLVHQWENMSDVVSKMFISPLSTLDYSFIVNEIDSKVLAMENIEQTLRRSQVSTFASPTLSPVSPPSLSLMGGSLLLQKL